MCNNRGVPIQISMTKIIRLNIGLAILTLLSGLLFFSLILQDGYQLYYAFILISFMTALQFCKLYFTYKANLPTPLFLFSVLMVFAIYTPLSDGWTHDIKITYPLSVIIYFTMTIFYVIETIYVNRQKNRLSQ